MYQYEGGTGFSGSLDWYPVIKKSISHITITRLGKETIFSLRISTSTDDHERDVQKRQIAITLEAFGIDL
jgi:hypothetical protein